MSDDEDEDDDSDENFAEANLMDEHYQNYMIARERLQEFSGRVPQQRKKKADSENNPQQQFHKVRNDEEGKVKSKPKVRKQRDFFFRLLNAMSIQCVATCKFLNLQELLKFGFNALTKLIWELYLSLPVSLLCIFKKGGNSYSSFFKKLHEKKKSLTFQLQLYFFSVDFSNFQIFFINYKIFSLSRLGTKTFMATCCSGCFSCWLWMVSIYSVNLILRKFSY